MSNAGFCYERIARGFTPQGVSNRSATASIVRPRLTDVASKQPIAQRNGDGQQPSRAYAQRSPREYRPWRPVVARVAEQCLAFGVLDHGFARLRCDACAHEYLLAFSCTCRYCWPSCHRLRHRRGASRRTAGGRMRGGVAAIVAVAGRGRFPFSGPAGILAP